MCEHFSNVNLFMCAHVQEITVKPLLKDHFLRHWTTILVTLAALILLSSYCAVLDHYKMASHLKNVRKAHGWAKRISLYYKNLGASIVNCYCHWIPLVLTKDYIMSVHCPDHCISNLAGTSRTPYLRTPVRGHLPFKVGTIFMSRRYWTCVWIQYNQYLVI